MSEFTLEVITPQGCLLKEQVEEATMITVVGEIGIRPEHCELISLLSEGTLSFTAKNVKRAIKVSRGTVQVNGTSAKVLSEHAEFAE